MLPEIGNMAPAFKLPDENGKLIKSTDFKGKKNIVLYFYPKAMTPGCTIQACRIRDSKKEFEKLDTVILGVSPDMADRLVKFIKKEELNFNLLSDKENKISRQYGVYGKKKFMGREYMGIYRTTFIIGKDGYLKHIIQKVDTKTHHANVMDFIKENLQD